MRGKTTCPQCGEKYSLDLPDDATGTHATTCPACKHSFRIDLGEKINLNTDDTPLIPPSLHFRPRSHRPPIAGVLLIIIGLAGIVFWGPIFLDHEAVLRQASTQGEWDISFQGKIVNETGALLPNVTVGLGNTSMTVLTDTQGKFTLGDIPWGYHLLHLSKTNFTTTHIILFLNPFHLREIQNEYVLLTGDSEITRDSQLVTDMDTYIPPVALLFLIFSALSLLGGLFSLQRKLFPLVILGAILGMCTLGVMFPLSLLGVTLGIFILGIFLIGFILSIAALILIVNSRYEFGGRKKEIYC